MHKGKTKFMTNIDTTDNIQINETEIEKMTNCKYLGQTIAMECSWKVQRYLIGQAPSYESKKKGL